MFFPARVAIHSGQNSWAAEGQFIWYPHTGEPLVGRVVLIDRAGGTASNFSCSNCCSANFDHLEHFPSSITGLVGGSQPMTVNEWDRDSCNQMLIGPYNVTSLCSYSSSNTAVATVSGSGFVSLVGVGSTTADMIYPFARTTRFDGFDCTTDVMPVSDSCPVTVKPTVTISGPNTVPLRAGVDGPNSIQLTASGNPAGGSYSWSTTSTKVTLTNTTSATVTVTSQAGSGAPGDVAVSVSYTLNNVASDPATQYITVQRPASLSIVPGTSSTTSEGPCTTPDGHAGCGVTRTFFYQVYDQLGGVMLTDNMPFWDSIQTGSPNSCNLTTFATTCGGPGPCGKTTTGGQFSETLAICAPACRTSSGTCTTGCTTAASQTWNVNGFSLSGDVKQLSYQCDRILVNGQ